MVPAEHILLRVMLADAGRTSTAKVVEQLMGNRPEERFNFAQAEVTCVSDEGLDCYVDTYNTSRPHQGRNMNGRTPITVFKAGLPEPTPKQKEKSPPQKTQP